MQGETRLVWRTLLLVSTGVQGEEVVVMGTVVGKKSTLLKDTCRFDCYNIVCMYTYCNCVHIEGHTETRKII